MKTQSKLQTLRKELNAAYLERGAVIDGLLAALLAGQNAVLYGPPGTGKSALLRSLCNAIAGADYFQRLLQKAMPPEELLGPISLKGLEQDILKRNTAGRLPEATIAFLDEVFKCNATTLNALLGLLNERVFENPDPQRIPLQFLAGAANRVPDEPELAPFVDRFIFRPWVSYTGSDRNKATLIEWACEGNQPQVKADQISLRDLDAMKAEAQAVTVSPAMRGEYLRAIKALGEAGFAISDRRIIQLLHLLKCYAYIQGHGAVYLDHLLALLPLCLWQKDPAEIREINKALKAACPHPEAQLKDFLQAARKEVERLEAEDEVSHNLANMVTGSLLTLETRVTELQAAETSPLPATAFEKALAELETLRLQVAEIKEAALYS
jgi:MoxR-like ATPase